MHGHMEKDGFHPHTKHNSAVHASDIHQNNIKVKTKKSNRKWQPTKDGIEKRAERLRSDMLREGYKFGVNPSSFIDVGGSNFNASESATPPNVKWVVYFPQKTNENQKKNLEDYLLTNDFKIIKRWSGGAGVDGGIMFQDKELNPTNETWHKLGYSSHDFVKLMGKNTWDDKGRNLDNPNFGK